MPQPPAFQFYPGDWILGTARMSLAEKGAYIDALAHQWQANEPVPGEPVELARIIRSTPAEAKAVWPRVSAKFPGGRNERLEEVRTQQAEFAQKNSDRGKKGARARWKQMPEQCSSNAQAHAQAHAQAMPGGMLGDGSSTSTSSTPASQNEAGDARAGERPHVRRRKFGDPFGFGTPKDAAELVPVGDGQKLTIPASWAQKARDRYRLTDADLEAFAKFLRGVVTREGVQDTEIGFLGWLDKQLGHFRVGRDEDRLIAAQKQATKDFIAEQDRHVALAASDDGAAALRQCRLAPRGPRV